MQKMKYIDIATALGCAALWGTNFVALKIAIFSVPPLFLSGIRLGIVGILLALFIKIPFRHFLALFLISISIYSLNFGLLTIGMTQIDAGLAALITQLEVPFSAILAAFILKDRMNMTQVVGMIVSFVGIFIACNTPDLHGKILPILLVTGGTISYSISNIQVKWMPKVDAFTMITYASLFASPQLLIASAFLEHNQFSQLANMNLTAGIAFSYTVCTATLAFMFWTRLIKNYKVTQVMPYALLIPVFGILSGILFLNEPCTIKIILGTVVTLLGLWLILFKPRFSGLFLSSTSSEPVS